MLGADLGIVVTSCSVAQILCPLQVRVEDLTSAVTRMTFSIRGVAGSVCCLGCMRGYFKRLYECDIV